VDLESLNHIAFENGTSQGLYLYILYIFSVERNEKHIQRPFWHNEGKKFLQGKIYRIVTIFSSPLTHCRRFANKHTEKCTITFILYITSGSNIAQFIWKLF